MQCVIAPAAWSAGEHNSRRSGTSCIQTDRIGKVVNAVAGQNAIDRLVAKEEIRDVIYQWSRGVARKDWELVKSCYTVDGVDRHGRVNTDVDGFIEWMKSYHATITRAIFFSSNILIEFVDEDRAFVETHGQSIQHHTAAARDVRETFLGPEWADKELPLVVISAGRKLDQFVRRDGVWRIAYRQQVYEYFYAHEDTGSLQDSPDFRVSLRDGADALYGERERAGLPRGLSL